MSIQIPKGLYDIVPYSEKEKWKLIDYWHYVEKILHKLSNDYNYKEIRTPIFERTELFERGVGQATDVVSKEMYTFKDKAERLMSLRPEGTASLMRAFIENNFASYSQKHKLYYFGPMFRYDRPQKGRFRQFYQYGAEAVGDPSEEQDVEIIDMLHELYQRLGLKDLVLHINYIGQANTRNSFKEELKKYLKPHLNDLSKESQDRFIKNPMRILDSKDERDIKILENAPNILEFITNEDEESFKKICNLLSHLKIPYKINNKLVRGLDYYNKTVFEITSSYLGAQNALGGGGRYDSLLKEFNGPNLPAIGYAVGIERILQTMIAQGIKVEDLNNPFIFIIPLGEKSKNYSFTLISSLRKNRIPCDIDFNAKKIQKSLQIANKCNAKYVIIIGDDEMDKKKLKIKNMEKRTEEEVKFDTLIYHIKTLYKAG